MNTDLKLDYWESKSLEILHKATIKQGIKASCTSVTNYGAVFTRDAAMAGISGILYNDTLLIQGLRSTVEMLNKLKGKQGQIASNFQIKNDNTLEHISFGTLSPKIDSATWYLVSIGLLMNHGYDYDISYVEDTIELLESIEYNGLNLMYIPQGGNWADEYPFEGYILYDQILRSYALQILGKHFKNLNWTTKASSIKNKILSHYFNSKKGYFNCSFRPSGMNETFDFAAHCLLGLLADPKTNKKFEGSLDWINNSFLQKEKLPVAFFPVIDKNHIKWSMLSNFHLYEFKNKPNHYHNGGVWFIWLGWYALTLNRHKRFDELHQLGNLCFNTLNKLKSFDFDEYLTGDTYTPNGTKELCYTATGILFLSKAIKDKTIDLF